ncbi:MAG: hypothetical protein ABSC04_02405 [Syntrophobacteraceae bacterium]|jgi:hypothetical protein
MSTSILYHAFGLKGIEYRATHFVAGRIVFSSDTSNIASPVALSRGRSKKTLKRQAYGFRGQEYFKLHLYRLHTQRYSLAG